MSAPAANRMWGVRGLRSRFSAGTGGGHNAICTSALGFTIQGRPKTQVALIAPDQPDNSFGSVDRDNRRARDDRTNAVPIRLELASQMVLHDAKVSKATLRFWAWDPSSHGRTKVAIYGLKTWDEASATRKPPRPARIGSRALADSRSQRR
ncbi:MAG TPA: hypothetical protein VHB77_07025 [Planctomycetaceae bacterium]|nr:hypothetical protein [Planctomycetaceae bacterium]